MTTETAINHAILSTRASREELDRQRSMLERLPIMKTLLDTVPNGIAVLNEDRQLLLANRALLEVLSLTGDEELIGLRPGEAFHCIRSDIGPDGCGTSSACHTCGALHSILGAQKTGHFEMECRLRTKKDGVEYAMDLYICSSTIKVMGQEFIVLNILDISHEKRRKALERIFFHDILNTAGSLKGVAELLRTEAPEDWSDLAETAYNVSDSLVNEIMSHRQLLAAENDELTVEPSLFSAQQLLRDTVYMVQKNKISTNRSFQIVDCPNHISVVSDYALLKRVLANLMINAVEACFEEAVVTVGCDLFDQRIEFWVNNPGVMSEEVQLQVFQRSFTTKGGNRGLGTYSVKLITERYLKGTVSFSSNEEQGTTFRVNYPVDLQDAR